MKFEGVHCKSFSALHNQYILTNISALCAFIKFFWFRTILNHMLKKHSKNQGSPMWCPWAPGRLQGPSRLSTGVAKRHGHQISSISCFALWEMLFFLKKNRFFSTMVECESSLCKMFNFTGHVLLHVPLLFKFVQDHSWLIVMFHYYIFRKLLANGHANMTCF